MAQKERLDTLLVNRGLYESREKAKSAIMAGLVFVSKERVDKAGTKVPIDAPIEVQGALHPYVSRGGLKLEKAIKEFAIDFHEKVVIDIGASTGGFTDCALQYGARRVYAVDVGYGQLAWSLRQDPRVVVKERTNFRYLTRDDLGDELPNIATIDVSFISLKLILPALLPLLAEGGKVITLIKPQFEAGKEKVGKKGIIREPDIHKEVIREILEFASNIGFFWSGLTYSPITGGEGNIEFLVYFDTIPINERKPIDQVVESIVAMAHEQLKAKTISE